MSKSASVYPALWKCSVQSQMTSKDFGSTCIDTYCGKEEHIPHSVALKSFTKTFWTVRIWKEKQRECINMIVRPYFPLASFVTIHLVTLSITQEADIISVADILALISFITLH